MAASGKTGLRNVIIASALGGLLVSGACIFMTGATVDKMKEQAVTAVANMPADAQPADGASSASANGKDTSSDASKPGASDGSSSSASPSSDGNGDGKDGIGASQGSEGSSGASADGNGDGSDGSGVEVVGSGTRNGEKVYIIKWGDTLSYISAETGFSVDEIANLNEIRDVDLIYADSALRIPDGD